MKKVMLTAFAVGLGLTASLWAQMPSYVPTNGLVGWWPFNGNANDESGNGNNGTVNGATLTADRFGVANKSYSFDGVDDKIIIQDANSLDLGISATFSFWAQLGQMNFDNVSSAFDARIIDKGTPGINDGYLIDFSHVTDLNSPYVEYLCTSNSTRLRTIVGNSINLTNCLPNYNNLNHYVITFNNGSGAIYINGLLNLNFSTNLPSIQTNSNNLVFGYQTSGNQNTWLNGSLDDIGIWNRALSVCEIQDLYNSQINSLAGSIAVSPQSASIASNVNLSTASNATNVQWQSNPSNYGWQNVPSNSIYSGGTTNTLTVNNVQLANQNQPFRIIASNGNCTDTSNIATIQITDTCITNVTVYDTLLTTVTDTLIINTTLSLPAPNNANTILIYPNPASDHITIDNGNFAAMAGYSIKIENNAGQQVFQSAINQAQFYVDLSTWTGNGLYFVHLIDPQNNTVTVRKIVLQ